MENKNEKTLKLIFQKLENIENNIDFLKNENKLLFDKNEKLIKENNLLNLKLKKYL